MRDKNDSQWKWWWKWVLWVGSVWFLMGLFGLPFSWDRWTDKQYLSAIFALIVIGAFEGYHRLKGIESAFKRLEEEQLEGAAILGRIEAGLKRLETEQQKLNRQQIRDAILIEQIVASLPSASGPANDLE